MLNSKEARSAAAAAANPSLQLQQQLAQVTAQSPSDTGSERGGSPHDSERSSGYSSRSMAQPLGLMTNTPGGLQYPPSPPVMQHPRSIHQLDFGITENMHDSLRGPGRLTVSDSSQKSFPCGTCGKGFARRSDLARHGEISSSLRKLLK
jgi:uncharacterized Zn-finger protein